MGTRVETDTMGAIEVPADRYWGAQTPRSLQHFRTRLGYDRAAEISKKAHREGITLKEAALALGHLTAEESDRCVQPKRMVNPPPFSGAHPVG